MGDIRRRLLLAQEPHLVELLVECCQTEDGRAWCQERYSLADVLALMWREKRGSLTALEPWRPFPEALVAALVPDDYDAQHLGQVLFPQAGRYRLEGDSLVGPAGTLTLSGLASVITARLQGLRLPHRLRMTGHGQVVHFTPAPAGQRISLSHGVLEESGAEVVAYGAKDTGEMGGGAAGSLLVACGPAIESAARQELAKRERTVGTVFLTPAFGKLAAAGTRWVCHLVSIIKHTPRGACCPEPHRLQDGLAGGLRLAHDAGAQSMAVAAMGTGEGGVPPEHCARMFISAARDFFREEPDSPLTVQFCLPVYRDYEAFERALAR